MKQRAVIRFFTLRRLTPKAIHIEFVLVYEEDTFVLHTIYKWYHRFGEGRIDFGDDPRPGRPLFDDLTQAIATMIEECPFISCKILCRYLRIRRQMCLRILHFT
jgi:hypothetical protein